MFLPFLVGGAVAQPAPDTNLSVNARFLIAARNADATGMERALAAGANVDSRNQETVGPDVRSMAPAAPRMAVIQNPSAKAMTAPKVRTVPQGTPVVVISMRSSVHVGATVGTSTRRSAGLRPADRSRVVTA